MPALTKDETITIALDLPRTEQIALLRQHVITADQAVEAGTDLAGNILAVVDAITTAHGREIFGAGGPGGFSIIDLLQKPDIGPRDVWSLLGAYFDRGLEGLMENYGPLGRIKNRPVEEEFPSLRGVESPRDNLIREAITRSLWTTKTTRVPCGKGQRRV